RDEPLPSGRSQRRPWLAFLFLVAPGAILAIAHAAVRDAEPELATGGTARRRTAFDVAARSALDLATGFLGLREARADRRFERLRLFHRLLARAARDRDQREVDPAPDRGGVIDVDRDAVAEL